MTSNRVKAAARQLQVAENLPYAEALRRVTTPRPTRPPMPPNHRHLGGLWLEDADGSRREICYRCATPAERDRVADIDQAALDYRVIRRSQGGSDWGWHQLDWPYGPNIDIDSREALVEWAAPLGMRSTTSSRRCLHWLRGNPCPWSHGHCTWQIPGADHVTSWNRGPGRSPAVLVSQPYHLDSDDVAGLLEIDESPEFTVEIDEAGGWYLHGSIFVTIWNAERHPSVSLR